MTMLDVYDLDHALEEALRLAQEAGLPDTYMKLEEARALIVSEFKAVRAIENAKKEK